MRAATPKTAFMLGEVMLSAMDGDSRGVNSHLRKFYDSAIEKAEEAETYNGYLDPIDLDELDQRMAGFAQGVVLAQEAGTVQLADDILDHTGGNGYVQAHHMERAREDAVSADLRCIVPMMEVVEASAYGDSERANDAVMSYWEENCAYIPTLPSDRGEEAREEVLKGLDNLTKVIERSPRVELSDEVKSIDRSELRAQTPQRDKMSSLDLLREDLKRSLDASKKSERNAETGMEF